MKQNFDAIFIAPPYKQGNETMYKQFDFFFPPYGMAHIASYIRQFNFSSIIIDCLVECPNLDDFENLIKTKYLNKITSETFAITAKTPIINNAFHIAKIIKKYYPKARVVLGGPHPTHDYYNCILNEYIDVVVIGEGEITFKEIMENRPYSEISGIAFKDSTTTKDNVIVTNDRKRIKNLDELPIPAYDLLDLKAYKAPKYSNQFIPSMSVVTSRGCIGNCTFCSRIFHGVRYMSAKRVFQEIELLYHTYGIRQIIFYDDVFTINKKRVSEFSQMIIDNKLNIRWTCFARVDCVDPPTLKIMKEAGCEHIMYGVENFNETILKNINKKINLDQVFYAVKITKEIGITCRISLMIGNPGETKAIIRENIKMTRKLKPDYLQVCLFHPLPGAPIYETFRNNNLITTENWDDFNFTKPLFIHDNLSQKQIHKYYILSYIYFYLSPWFIFNQIKNLNKRNERKRLLWGFKTFLIFVYKNSFLIFRSKRK